MTDIFLSWCKQALSQILSHHNTEITLIIKPLAGDAGHRQYFRITAKNQHFIGVLSPENDSQNTQFIQISDLLHQHNIPNPTVLAQDLSQGFLIISDLGDQLLFDTLNTNTSNHPYQTTLDLLLKIQTLPQDKIPPYSQTLLNNELQLFNQWFISDLLAYHLTPEENHLIQQTYQTLVSQALVQTQVFIHRDFHSRNIMCLPDKTLAVIDFQDAVIGPITYDLVSLLRDCYIHWPENQVASWVKDYAQISRKQGLHTADDQTFKQWFDAMGLQRHLKVLGIFSRLHLRDGKSQYLNDLPLVLHYTLTVLSQYPEHQAFYQWFKQSLLPIIQQQTWYCEIT